MTAAHESTPYQGEPDSFDLLIGELLEGTRDPYLEQIHTTAREYEEFLHAQGSPLILRKRLVDLLDEEWRYTNRYISITGTAWIKDMKTGDMVERQCNGEEVRSHGFIFFTDETSAKPTSRIAHAISFDEDDARVPGAICLDDLLHLELPEASPELRAKRFAYGSPEQAEDIRDLIDGAQRADQELTALSNFYMDLNLSTDTDREKSLDCAAFIRDKVSLEPIANYRMAILGEVLIHAGKDDVVPHELTKMRTRHVKINEIVFRPADIRLTDEQMVGWHLCVPFINVTDFRPDGRDLNMLLPLTSIAWMHSIRYGGLPDPAAKKITTEKRD